jgi:transposase-like protein
MNKRKIISREFKREAMRLLEEGRKPAAGVTLELEIRRNQLYKWKEAMDKQGGNAYTFYQRGVLIKKNNSTGELS